MPSFLILTTENLREAYFLAAFLEARGATFAIVNVRGRPLAEQVRIFRRLRRNRGSRYVVDLLAARAMRRLLPRRGPGAFPEIDEVRIAALRARWPTMDCRDPHDPDVLGFVSRFAPDYILLAGAPVLRSSFFGLARRAALNRHLSLLPGFRGSDCPLWALAQNRPDRLGYTIHLVTDQVDRGHVVVRRHVPVGEPDLGAYMRRLQRAASEGFIEVLGRLLHDEPLVTVPQEEAGPYFPPAGWTIMRRAARAYERLVAGIPEKQAAADPDRVAI